MELAQDRDERIVRGLHREVIEVAGRTGCARPTPSDLDAGRPQQQCVQAPDGVLVLRSVSGERSNPCE
jgi:hypothetical protein